MESSGDPGRRVGHAGKGYKVKLKVVALVPKDLVLDVKKMDRAVNNALDGSALAAKVDFDTTTRTWRRRPGFLIKTPRYGVRDIYTIDAIYSYVSGGTRAHIIRPRRRGGMLAFFRSGFRPKTRHQYIGSNKGKQATSDFTLSKGVMHPGNKPRELDIAIQKKWQKQLSKTLQRSIDAEI